MTKRLIMLLVLLLVSVKLAEARPRSVQLDWLPCIEGGYKVCFAAQNCATAILTVHIKSDVVVDSTWYRTMLVRTQGLKLTRAQTDTIRKLLVRDDFPTTTDRRLCRYLKTHWFEVTVPNRYYDFTVRMAKPATKMSSSGRWQEAGRQR